jgi:endonuclease III
MPRESLAAKRRRAVRLEAALARLYPDARCSLDYADPYQLWVATVLSAQCTDERVNRVTPDLFAAAPDVAALAALPTARLEDLIRSTGFFRTKSRNLQAAAARLLAEHGGRLPADMAALTALPGVGRKTANVILGNAFGLPGLPVDTHVGRLARRLGLTRQEDPVKVEAELMALLPAPTWTALSHRLIQHGRLICASRKPRCAACALAADCPSASIDGQ